MATGGGNICVDGGSLSRWQARSPLRAAPTPQKSPKAIRAIPDRQDPRAIRALRGLRAYREREDQLGLPRWI